MVSGAEDVCPEETVILGIHSPDVNMSYLLQPMGIAINAANNFQHEVTSEGIYWFSVQAENCEIKSDQVEITHKPCHLMNGSGFPEQITWQKSWRKLYRIKNIFRPQAGRSSRVLTITWFLAGTLK